MMSAGVTVQSTICSEATTATKAPGVALIAARRFTARCRSGVCSRETDSVRCITTKLLQANYVADLAQGWQCDRTARRLHADDRTVSGCAGPRLDRRGENIRAHPCIPVTNRKRATRETRRSWEKTSRSVLCAGRACQQDLGVPPIACHPSFPTYTEFHAPNVRYFVRAIPWQSLAVRGTPWEAMREEPLRETVTDRGNMQAVQTLAGEQSANCDARILSPLHHVCFQWLSLAVRRTCARQVRLGQASSRPQPRTAWGVTASARWVNCTGSMGHVTALARRRARARCRSRFR